MPVATLGSYISQTVQNTAEYKGTEKTAIQVGQLRVSTQLLEHSWLTWLTHFMSWNTWDCRWSQKTWAGDKVLRAPCGASCSALMVVNRYGTELNSESRENSSTQESFWFITPPSSAAPGHICLGSGAAAGVWVEAGQPCQTGREAWTSLKSCCVSQSLQCTLRKQQHWGLSQAARPSSYSWSKSKAQGLTLAWDLDGLQL